MRNLFLGDIHGNFNVINQYIKLYDIKDANIIQVGDFGVGFSHINKETRVLADLNTQLIKRNIYLWATRGNHDFPGYFDNDPFNLSNIKLVKDYTLLNIGGKNIFFIGGAVSVDRKTRQTKKQRLGDYTLNGNESWWSDEILNFNLDKLNDINDIDIVVTHTAPHYCRPDNTFGFGPFVENIIKDNDDQELRSDLLIERKQMTDIFNILNEKNKITHHYYGHFHQSHCETFNGIKHRLLGVDELWEEKE